jgi:hypothetical protein
MRLWVNTSFDQDHLMVPEWHSLKTAQELRKFATQIRGRRPPSGILFVPLPKKLRPSGRSLVASQIFASAKLLQRGIDRCELVVEVAAQTIHHGDDGKRNASRD